MNRRILLCFAELNVTVVTSTLKRGLGHWIVVNLGVGGLDFSLVEHRLQRSWLVIVLAIKEFYLQEIMSVIKVISEEITDKLFNNHTFLIFEIGV